MNTQRNVVQITNIREQLEHAARLETIKEVAKAIQADTPKKIWRTAPDHHYGLEGEGDNVPHYCNARAETNGM